MKYTYFSFLALLLAFTSCGGSSEPQSDDSSPKEENKTSVANDKLLKQAQAYFKVLPEASSFDRPIAKLGKKLYYETALSFNGEMSCNSCHMLDNFGVDNEPTSPGHEGKRGDRNSPTVYNAYFHIAQFWDGRAEDLKAQAAGPILNPIEMGVADSVKAVENIEAIQDYVGLFKEAFPNEENPISYDNITEAIAEFEKTLRTPSKFDEYLSGNTDALNPEELKGMETFINSGCITCHMGPGLGGQMYQKFGLVNGPYWEYTGSERHDEGRFEVTGKEADKQMFKVATLRNVAKTAPYFHDGSVESLEEAVKIMGKTQLGRDLTDADVKSIVTFLNTLTGEIPEYALNNQES